MSSRAEPAQATVVAPATHRVREAVAILAVAVAAWFLLALASFSTDDPGWSYAADTRVAENLAGTRGAWIADILLSLFGWFAWLPPLVVLLLVLRRWRPGAPPEEERGFDRVLVALRIVGVLLAMASGCLLADLHFVVVEGSLPAGRGAGGILGEALSGFTLESVGLPGVTLLALAVFLLGITLATGLSWIALTEMIGRRALDTVAALRTLLAERRLARAERRRAAQEQARRREKIEQEVTRRETRTPPRIEAPKPAVEPGKRAEREKARDQQQRLFELPVTGEMPPLQLLDEADTKERPSLSKESLEALSRLLELKLKDFGVEAEVVAVHPGPVITRFEIQPAAGVKVARIAGLAKDLARSLAVISVRVVEVIPGKSTVGIEIPNEDREMVRLREVLASKAFENSTSPVTLVLGKDISGQPVVADLAKMPHLLVAGTTGSGKSVGVNAMLLSFLFRAQPADLRLILVDPKMLELSVYEGIPHLLTPVVTDMKEAASALRWCVGEMERRYRLMAALGVRNLAGYNRKVRAAMEAGEPIPDPLAPKIDPTVFTEGNAPPEPDPLEPLPAIVVVIDEFADMMMIVGKKVEELIARIAQKARAAGIHLILATQRPSVDVITGLIKANIPTRMSFQVSSKVDSRTILDQGGAEQLLGHGDMLYLPPGTAVPVRVHGAFVGDDEVHRVVADWKKRGAPDYLEEVLDGPTDIDAALSGGNGGGGDTEQDDPLYDEAIAYVLESRRASISSVQRKLRIGYNRAARLIEAMEAAGVVSAMDASGGREVLAPARED
ncbi:MAG: DNA translocase FtsK 4TM domain-containing protein [Pseudomonadales bacterium]|nr:DNA translocase FtsK 4TM domain-containing protein [Pseudomonadales bacterium]